MHVCFHFYIFRARFNCKRCSFITIKRDGLERHERENHDRLAKCGFGCNFIFPIHKKCLLRDHHKRCHLGLLHRDPIMCDRPRSRSRSPIGIAPTVQTGNSPLKNKTPTMSDVDECEFFYFVEDDIDHNNNVSGVSKLRGGSPKGDVLGPASPSQVPVQWKLTPIDVDVAKPLYSFLPRPCRYTEYYLKGDPRFQQK